MLVWQMLFRAFQDHKLLRPNQKSHKLSERSDSAGLSRDTALDSARIKSLYRGVAEENRGYLYPICRSELFNHRSPRTGSCHGTRLMVAGTSFHAL